jgi:cellulose synthase (UDP-forming)
MIMMKDATIPATQISVRTEKVFKWWDYCLFTLLTVAKFGVIVYFLWYWFSFKDWLDYPFSFSVLTFIVLAYVAIDQLRWFSLPSMKRPRPMTPRVGWKVCVVTTFVPGMESLEMLEDTIKALIALDYPHDTWILDEGDDDQVKTLCLRSGAYHFSRKNLPQYLTESGIFQSRSKHGNYNAWLYEIGFDRYEIVTAFDPDHIPDPVFLSNVLGYFEDPQVAYVQVAQAYYNQKASFIARGAAEETYRYYSSTLMASYGMGHPIVIGCHNTHRMTALKQVGGFAPHDADDLLIALLYQKCGWQGVYIPQILARGLTPVDWNGYLTQQLRWARSVLDLKYRLYPKLSGKLPLKERALILLQGVEYLHGILMLIGLIQLASMLATGITPRVFSLSIIPKVFTLYSILQLCNLYRQRFYLDVRREIGIHWRAVLLKLAKWPFIIAAIYDVVIGHHVQYAVTKKVKSAASKHILLPPYTLIIFFITICWIIGIAYNHIDNLLLHISAAVTVFGALCLVLTELLDYPDPFDRKLLED